MIDMLAMNVPNSLHACTLDNAHIYDLYSLYVSIGINNELNFQVITRLIKYQLEAFNYHNE